VRFDVEHLLPLLERHLLERHVALQPGVVDQDVERAEALERLREHPLDVRSPGDVALDRERLAASGLDLADD
jgi:hypothetical protein